MGGVLELLEARRHRGVERANLVVNLESVPPGSLFASSVITAYDAEYEDVRIDDVVRPGAQTVVEEMATRCLAEPGVLVSVLTSFGLDQPIWSTDPLAGPFGKRLRENVPDGAIEAPPLLAQGGADPLVLPSAQDAYVQDRCDAGHAVDYRVYEGRDHVPLVEPDSPARPRPAAVDAGPPGRRGAPGHLRLSRPGRRTTCPSETQARSLTPRTPGPNVRIVHPSRHRPRALPRLPARAGRPG